MSDLTLEAYAQDLIADVLATAEAESTTAPETFTRRALDDLEQAGVTENTFTAYYRAHGVEVSGYGSSDSLGSLDVFISSFRQYLPDARMPRAEVETLLRRALTFIQRCRDGLRHDVDESSDVYDMCLAVEKKLPEAPRLRLFLLTNSITTVTTLPDSSLDGLPVSYEIWDLARFHRMATSGTLSEPIVVEFDDPLPCLVTPETEPRLLRLPDHPARAYALGALRPVRHPAAGAERPLVPAGQGRGQPRHPRHAPHRPGKVSRLQQRHHRDSLEGRVHYAARRRPGDPPHPRPADRQRRADHCVHPLRPRPRQGRHLRCLRADEAHGRRARAAPGDRPADLHVLQHPEQGHPRRLQLQPPVPRRGREDHTVAVGARRTTAAARRPAGSTNEPEASTLTRSPANAPRPGSASFKALHPLRQKFTKADAAKFEHSWDQLPHIVSRGAEKNFREFMIRLGEKTSHRRYRLLSSA